jgi:hypothetical protein
MMDTMYTTGFGTASTALWGVHVLSVILFFTGVILLIHWAVKTLNQGQLKTWGIALVVIGTIACLLTIGARGAVWTVGSSNMKMMNMQMMEKMMNGMMDDDDGSADMDHMDMSDNEAMSMSMDDMSAMLEGKTGDKFDEAFIRGMIPHHQGAIDMAELALANAKHGEIREMAADIITAQQSEIDMMNQWLKDWGYTQ